MSQQAIRICLVSPLPPPYGGIAHWTALISAYAKNRQDVVIFQVNTAPSWRSIHQTGIAIRAIGGSFQLLLDVIKLCVALCRNRFDAIHLTTSGHLGLVRDLAVAVISKIFSVPLVLHIRFGRVPAIASKNSLEWRLMRTVMKMSSRVVLIDRATYEAVRNHSPKINAELIPNCVNTHLLPSIQPRDCHATRSVLFLGWVIPEKGIDELLSAWDRIRPKGWRLDLVGSYSTAYRDQLIEKHDAKNVNFLGELPHGVAMQHLASCDLFVLPSYSEGFPNVVVEAMALGRAILATNVGAIPEMLAGCSGVVVSSKDVQELEREMQRLIFDEEARISFGEAAKEKAIRCYSIEAVFQNYMRVWKDVSVLR
ncbi:glycosyltransferase involved in cell wall biosynthesis [Variovorax boronicumulans]|uniref:glycosyltransferase family 4 protein n=1 Tax=Variovorax boronicumulans TaxID=436515 RepID=UPI002781AB5F|nr:glycosyltransferase family 4 protein [Variovorax boronicumulans]MDQ0033397.1 glycosyltransferase involved in cell wall biosynthesis [Variovorax boronicumulans]MDQ0072566.1 glycosyltransferase involved in cell wall biosynthesis [Variovorax boronicumulans]